MPLKQNKRQLPVYQKQHSFENFSSLQSKDIVEKQIDRAIQIAQNNNTTKLLNSNVIFIIQKVLSDLLAFRKKEKTDFYITQFIAEEMLTLNDDQLISYLYHRYRYDVFPCEQKMDDYPPYLQIEPSSACNFRCVFGYQSDKSYNNNSSGYLGTMTFDMFKRIVDQVEGKVEFISLASRGEPLLCKDITKMLEYSVGKFLGLKVNTNASLLTEQNAHAILAGGVKTLVFSVDAAEEALYEKLRVNGSLKKTIKNIERFHTIRARYYPHSRLITRISGVLYNNEQNIESMQKLWGSMVDQITFVKYNPIKNIYSSPPNTLTSPCSELWRRMFVWFDGTTNICENDYKSTLAVGNVNEKTITELWQSEPYRRLREIHFQKQRGKIEPCLRCYVV